MATKLMKMVHKGWNPEENRQPAEVTPKAFESVWKDKGWVEFKEDDSPAPSSASSSASKPASSGGSDK